MTDAKITTPRQALLQVAHLFDTKPGCYRFRCTSVPKVNDEPHWRQQACVLGWVAYFADLKADTDTHPLVVAADFVYALHPHPLGNTVSIFYSHMDALEGDDNWVTQADVCARIVRKYADRYFPADKGVTP